MAERRRRCNLIVCKLAVLLLVRVPFVSKSPGSATRNSSFELSEGCEPWEDLELSIDQIAAGWSPAVLLLVKLAEKLARYGCSAGSRRSSNFQPNLLRFSWQICRWKRHYLSHTYTYKYLRVLLV